MASYTRLVAWQAADALSSAVYRATKRFPAEERFGATSQLRRAALSVPTNLAEGQAAIGRGEKLRYAGIAAASLTEVDHLLRHALRSGFLSQADYDGLLPLRKGTTRLLYGLIKSLRKARAD